MDSSAIAERFAQLRSFLGDPTILFPVLVGGIIVILLSFSQSKRWWLLSIWVFSLSLARFENYGVWVSPVFPFNLMVNYGRTVGTVVTFAMLPAAWVFFSRKPGGHVPRAAWAMLIFYLCFCVRYLPTQSAGLAVTRIFVYLSLFFLLGMSLPRWITNSRELVRSLSAAGFSMVLLAACSAASYIALPASASWNGRFFGLTSNPNLLGMPCAFAMPVLLGLAAWKHEKHGWRTFWTLSAGLVMIALIWTGSRGPMGVTAVGAIVFFRVKLGRLLIVAVPLAASIWGLSLLLEDSFQSASRFTNFTDTRTAGWSYFIDLWQRNPVLGNADLKMAVTENSYLTILANAGLVGLGATLWLLYVWGTTCYQLLHLKPADKNSEILRDMALSGIVAILAAAVFEGILLSSVASTTFFIFYYCLLAQLAQQYSSATQQVHQYAQPGYYVPG